MSAFPPDPDNEFKKFQFAFATIGGAIWTIILLAKLFVR